MTRGDRQRGGLGDLGEQAVDLGGDELPRRVRVLGVQGAAGPTVGDGGHELLVVVEAVSERGGRDALAMSGHGYLAQPPRVGDAHVGVPVRDQQEGRAAVARRPMGLVDAAQQSAGQVGGIAGAECGDRVLGGAPVGQRPGGHVHLGGVVEADQAEVVGRVKPVHQGEQRSLSTFEAASGHGAAAVEDDLKGGGLPERGRLRFGGGDLDEDGDLVLLVERDHVEVQVCGDVHVVRPFRRVGHEVAGRWGRCPTAATPRAGNGWAMAAGGGSAARWPCTATAAGLRLRLRRHDGRAELRTGRR